MFEHLDEGGTVCTRHAPNASGLLALATIGSRVSGFNHDIASKLQAVMMTLDEISEHVERDPNPALRSAVEDAIGALQEATTLLTANRALTRIATKSKAALRDVIDAASNRIGVTIRGALPDGQIETAVPLLTQGFALVLDALVGTGRARSVDVAVSGDTFVFTSSAEPTATFHDALALASFVIATAGGELRCGERKVIVKLPLAAPG